MVCGRPWQALLGRAPCLPHSHSPSALTRPPVHANFENSGLEAGEYDVVMLQFVMHELPAAPTKAMAEEAMRVLRPGGVLALVDNDPQSPVIQGPPAPIFSLMKSTEPHSDEYYAFSQEANLEAAGFVDVCKAAVDPRHRLVLARKP